MRAKLWQLKNTPPMGGVLYSFARMPSLSIRTVPDPLLKHPTRLVERVDGAVVKLVDAMIATMRRHPRCVGLAAPQVGSHLRLAVMDATGHPKARASSGLLVLVNPQIEAAEGAALQREGCLSIPDFTGNVWRATRLRLRAVDRSGRPYACWLEGFEAVIAQHEVDHLEGRLFLDRLANAKADLFPRKTYY